MIVVTIRVERSDGGLNEQDSGHHLMTRSVGGVEQRWVVVCLAPIFRGLFRLMI